MRFRTFLFGVVSLVAVSAQVSPLAQASQIGYEGFITTFPAFNTGSGFTLAWALGGFNASAANYFTHEASLAYFGLPHSGGRVVGVASPQINGARRTLANPLGADNTVAYISVLLQPQGTLNDGVFSGFFGLTLNGSLSNDLFFGKPGGGALENYVIEHRGGFGQIPSAVPVEVDRTALLVLKAEFLTGNDVFTLYVDPVPGAPEPIGGVVKTDMNLGMVTAIGIYSTGAFAIDEIRVGTTYSDVVPPPAFAGTPGQPNCHGKTVSALAGTHNGLADAAAALGFPTVQDLHAAIDVFCE